MTAHPPPASHAGGHIEAALDAIVKAYDVRGRFPEQWDTAVAERIGAAFARWLLDTGQVPDTAGSAVVVAGDMRPSSPDIIDALVRGITAQGLDAQVTGLASTDQLYFASGSRRLPGIMVTASHNPAAYNGLKLCRAGAAPIGAGTGLTAIRELAGTALARAARPGERIEIDTLDEYADYLHALVPLDRIRPLRVVVDAGNGMAGHTVPAVLGRTSAQIVPLYFELDGTFPNHPADPLDPANLVDLQAAVVREGADLGLAFDGDADRCFVVDETGAAVSASAITALIARRALAAHPGDTVVHNVITSRCVREVVTESGGVPSRTKVGHSNMKAEMARTNAVFGGEHSAHYYFRDFYFADTGMLAAMHVLATLGGQDRPLSELIAEYQRYVASGEINSTVSDTAAALAAVRAVAVADGATVDELDGVTATYDEGAWWNVRASNTEPLLRLNVEARDAARMGELRDRMLRVIRGRAT